MSASVTVTALVMRSRSEFAPISGRMSSGIDWTMASVASATAPMFCATVAAVAWMSSSVTPEPASFWV